MNNFILPLAYSTNVVSMLASIPSFPFALQLSVVSSVVADIGPTQRNCGFSNINADVPSSNNHVSNVSPINNAPLINVPNVSPISNVSLINIRNASSNTALTNNQISGSTVSVSSKQPKKKGPNSNDKSQTFDQKIDTEHIQFHQRLFKSEMSHRLSIKTQIELTEQKQRIKFKERVFRLKIQKEKAELAANFKEEEIFECLE
jgi:hypothetical protein